MPVRIVTDGSSDIPREKIYMSRISPVVGTHLGPYAIGGLRYRGIDLERY
jgi:fatty acid-binding protein DegV